LRQDAHLVDGDIYDWVCHWLEFTHFLALAFDLESFDVWSKTPSGLQHFTKWFAPKHQVK